MRIAIFGILSALFLTSCSTWPGTSSSASAIYFHSTKGDLYLDCINGGKVTNTIITKAGTRLSQEQIEHVFMTLDQERPRTVAVEITALQGNVVFYDTQHRMLGVLHSNAPAHEPKSPPKAQKN